MNGKNRTARTKRQQPAPSFARILRQTVEGTTLDYDTNGGRERHGWRREHGYKAVRLG